MSHVTGTSSRDRSPRRVIAMGQTSYSLLKCRSCTFMLVAVFMVRSIQNAETTSGFDPYQLNGGLLAAVAGSDYVVLAADTRMVGPGGYDILERDHVSSRIWSATEYSKAQPIQNTETSITTDIMRQESARENRASFGLDGALRPPQIPDLSVDGNNFNHTHVKKELSQGGLRLESTEMLISPLVLVGSGGCNADCEMLKRLVRSDLRAARYFVESVSGPSQVATLLSQILYSRRGFPFYSFCVVGGLDATTRTSAIDLQHAEGVEGKVYVYDAIGSYEQVAVATTGSGREMLQPILDRKFRSLLKMENEDLETECSFRGGDSGNLARLPHALTHPKQVACAKEEAIQLLLEGYRAVAEREISVGDRVVFCVLATSSVTGQVECQVWSAPLKSH